ncbi:MAG: response regulator transcription factor [Vicinamibacterales bacterium]
MRVLLVEDDAGMAVIVAAGLAQAHCHVETVANGLLAIEHARCKAYGLVVLDLTLPGLDGLDVCRRLRQARNDVPILVISGRTGLDDRVQALDAGADDYIVKPFDRPNSWRGCVP